MKAPKLVFFLILIAASFSALSQTSEPEIGSVSGSGRSGAVAMALESNDSSATAFSQENEETNENRVRQNLPASPVFKLIIPDFFRQGNKGLIQWTVPNGFDPKRKAFFYFSKNGVNWSLIKKKRMVKLQFQWTPGKKWITDSGSLRICVKPQKGANVSPVCEIISGIKVLSKNAPVPADTSGPIISNIRATSITSNSAIISWTTNEISNSTVSYGLTTNYGGNAQKTTFSNSHVVSLTGLRPNATYHYRVASADDSGNVTNSIDSTFTTPALPDTSGPVLGNIQASATATTAAINWTTNEQSSSRVDYGTTSRYGNNVSNANRVTAHSIALSNLTPNTTYHYRVVSADPSGNVTNGIDSTFKTLAPPDTTSPVISSIQASATATSATISWTTNEQSVSRVDYGTTNSYGNNVSNANRVTTHSIALPNLTPNTTYHYRVSSSDASGNAASSPDRTITTRNTAVPGGAVSWLHLSSRNGDLPVPPTSLGQVEIKVVDLDKDGLQDYVLNMWQRAGTSRDTMVWYQHQRNGSFVKFLIDNEKINLSHSERFNDIDGDGDLDLIIGQASSGNTIDWWENPYPNYSTNTPWIRRQVYSGTVFYHDGIWGDFDEDGAQEYMSWNQGSKTLLLFEKPANPKTAASWPVTTIFAWTGGGQGFGSDHRYRGTDAIDMNGDGKIDFVGGCGWFEHTGGTNYTQHIIDEVMGYSQIQAAQLVQGGLPEVLCLKELEPGPLNMYQWNGSGWQTKTLIARVNNAHTLQTGDINLDGKQDIVFAEMGHFTTSTTPDYPNAGLYVLYGDGNGNFTLQTVFQGQGHLEGQLADIDNDGDLDIVTKPFKHNMPMVEIYLNQVR